MNVPTKLCLALVTCAAGCPGGGSGSASEATAGDTPATSSGTTATAGSDSSAPTTSGGPETSGPTTTSGDASTSSSSSGGVESASSDASTSSSSASSSSTGEVTETGVASETGESTTTTGLEPGVCGDGVLNLGEACDDGDFDNTDDCTEYCLEPACGDGYLQPGNGETCDDGNQVDGDGCNSDCFQSGDTVWSVSFDGADHLDDHGYAVAVDGAGAVVVVGSTTVPGEDANVLLWKVTGELGAELWHRDLPNPGADLAHDVAIDSADRIVATGTYFVGAQPDPGGKIWTAGFAPNGNEIWSATTASDGNGKAIAVAPDDSVYTTGDIQGGNIPQLWLERRDAGGASLWTKQDVYGDDSSCDLDYHEHPEGVAVDPPHVYVVWRSTCPGGQFPAAPRSKVSKFTEAGALVFNPNACCSHWRIDVETPGVFTGVPTRAYEIVKAPDDSLVIAGLANNGGHVWGYGPDLYTTTTYASAAWEKAFPGAAFADAAIDGEGNIVLVGGERVVKADPDAQLLWQKTEPGVTARGVAVDDDGYVYAVGSSPGEGADVWLRKLAP